MVCLQSPCVSGQVPFCYKHLQWIFSPLKDDCRTTAVTNFTSYSVGTRSVLWWFLSPDIARHIACTPLPAKVPHFRAIGPVCATCWTD